METKGPISTGWHGASWTSVLISPPPHCNTLLWHGPFHPWGKIRKKKTNRQTKEQIFKNNNWNYATISTSPGSFCLWTGSFGFYLINLNKPVDGFSQALGETFSLLFKVTSAFTVSVSSLNERQRWRKREECQNQKEKKSLLKPTLQRLLNTKAI